MRKYIFPKKCSFYVFLVFLMFFYRYLFSCHVVPVPLFRPSLTCVYEKQLCLDTFCWKKHCIGNVRHAKVHFPKKCSFWVFLVFLMFFSRYPFSCHVVPVPLFRPSLTCVYEKQLCLDTFCWKKHCIGNVRHAKVHFPKKNARSMSFSCFSCFSRYPFSCHVVPFPLFRPSLTRVYEKQLFLDTFCWKKHCIGNVRHAKVHFPKKMLVLCLSRVSRFFPSRYPFSCHVVPFPLFRPSLTRVYEKQLFLDTFCWKKHCIGNLRHAKVHFPKKCSFYVFLVFLVFFFSVPILVPCRSVSVVPAIVNSCLWKTTISWYFLLKKTLYRQRQTCESTFSQKNARSVSFSCLSYFFFLGTHSRLMVHFSYRLILCLVLLGFSCLMLFPFFCSRSISFCVFLVFLVFFSRYPFSCHVVPFPLFRPSLTCVYEKKSIFWYFLLKKTLYRQRQTCESTFFPKNGLNTSKMYRYIFDVLEKNVPVHFWRTKTWENVQYIFGGPPP